MNALSEQVDALIEGDFSVLTHNTAVGRPIPHSPVRQRFESEREWELFVHRSWTRWRAYAKASQMTSRDIVFLANSLRETLQAEP